ncbi:DNA-binding protein [Trinickia caryophylli]|uniref:Transcriptional regulator, AlpA family n=1 Tax=Trinickia caryophylli TaxID=28094 RepID=A0A1X7CHP7_TRICW|nr:DNA-binding protein [Trinickia caryophylli]PMS11566.1 DNA-binding protein [Trinickia caryophylli]TRX19881.1 DNA-binding protein [Trinickia caryophylli]WQE12784.1 DNA-binding protein [Trinickia caryophylli]SME96667.1 transcriptional regulator, AlpA family [Trinickia caryophylli]GLU30499.1 DNA-binding protein [Trinickia caryophylli]
MEYTFTLRYRLPDSSLDPDDLMERLGAAGCDDALVGTGLPGRVALEFTREAPSAREAFLSALADVRRAVPGGCLIEAVPDFVGLTDVAQAVGVTRQNMRKLMIAHAGSFPAPVHCGSAAIWHLAEVLAWLRARGSYDVGADLWETAAAAMQINVAKAARQAAPAFQEALGDLVE